MRRIVAIGIIIFALATASFVAYEWPTIERGEVCEKNEYTKQKDCTYYKTLSFILIKIVKTLDHHEGTVVGIGTMALAIFTWRLWVSTHRLWQETVRASGTAVIAANAARDSADAAVKASMPIIIPLILDSSRLLPDMSSENFVPELTFALENHGKTPGIVTKLVFELCLEQTQPTKPPWINHIRNTDPHVIPGETRQSNIVPVVTCKFHRAITKEEISGLKAKISPESPQPRYFFYGYVIYDDVFGYQHIRGVGRKVFHSTDGKIAPQASRGGDAFEYYHRIDRRDYSPS